MVPQLDYRFSDRKPKTRATASVFDEKIREYMDAEERAARAARELEAEEAARTFSLPPVEVVMMAPRAGDQLIFDGTKWHVARHAGISFQVPFIEAES